jgi:ribosomal protein S24E
MNNMEKKMDTIKDFRNDLLKRREVKLVVTADKNPGFADATKAIADKFKSNEDVIVVRTLKSKFGRDSFLIDAFIYDSVQDKNTFEPKKKEKKKEGAAAQPEVKQETGGKK